MNWDRLSGNWKQLKGEAQAKWGDLTDDEWHQIEGNWYELIGLIQEKYGYSKEAAEHDVDECVGSI